MNETNLFGLATTIVRIEISSLRMDPLDDETSWIITGFFLINRDCSCTRLMLIPETRIPLVPRFITPKIVWWIQSNNKKMCCLADLCFEESIVAAEFCATFVCFPPAYEYDKCRRGRAPKIYCYCYYYYCIPFDWLPPLLRNPPRNSLN